MRMDGCKGCLGSLQCGTKINTNKSTIAYQAPVMYRRRMLKRYIVAYKRTQPTQMLFMLYGMCAVFCVRDIRA